MIEASLEYAPSPTRKWAGQPSGWWRADSLLVRGSRGRGKGSASTGGCIFVVYRSESSRGIVGL